jgi:thioester reductase-like protein
MKHVLITGVTGIVGSAIAPLFLNDSNTHVYLLIRVKAGESAQERLKKLWDFWGNDIIAPDANTRLTIITSNHLDQAQLGLEASAYDMLVKNLTHIIHCAGSINLNMPDEIAKKNTYLITEQIVQLAKEASAYHFKKLDYVSTVGVAGKNISPVPEQLLPDVTEFQNNYEKYKAHAERLLFNQALPFAITLHRPSMVVGHSQTGKIISFKGVYYLISFFAGEFTYGIVPRIKDIAMDMIPVDYVAKAIYWSSSTSVTDQKILHLCAGENNRVNLYPLISLVQKTKKELGKKCCRLIPLPPVLFWKLLAAIKHVVFHPTIKKFLGSLGVFASYFDQPQRFDVKYTSVLLQEAQIDKPNTASFLPNIISYYYEHNKRD